MIQTVSNDVPPQSRLSTTSALGRSPWIVAVAPESPAHLPWAWSERRIRDHGPLPGLRYPGEESRRETKTLAGTGVYGMCC
jgi:hypothetical protein